jgi:hypothetical protein
LTELCVAHEKDEHLKSLEALPVDALVGRSSIVVFFIFSQNAIIRANGDRKD